MSPIGTLLIQLAVGAVPIAVAAFAYFQATKANRVTVDATERIAFRNAELERNKVDAEAFNRAKEIYEAALTQLEKQLDRIQAQFDRLNEQLGREQDTSNALRTQVNTLQRQVTGLEGTLSELRRRLGRTGGDMETKRPGKG